MSTTEKTGRFPMKNPKQLALRTPPEITGTEGRCVSIVRRGSANSNLMIETGKKHYCLYGTPFGDMTLGIYTNKMEDNLSPQGGRLYLRYTLDVNASFLSDNEIYLEVVTQPQEA